MIKANLIIFYLFCELMRYSASEISIYHYYLRLYFNEDTLKKSPYQFEAELEIGFSLSYNYPTDIKLNAAAEFISIKSATITVNGVNSKINSFYINDYDDILTLNGTQFAIENMNMSTIFINYTSRLSVDDMYGLYRGSFMENNEEKFFIASQFVPTFARRLLPCQDELTSKTFFYINVTHPHDMDVYFNTAENIYVNSSSTGITYFAISGAMSPYMAELILTNKNDFSCSVGQNFTYGSIYYFRVCSRENTQNFRSWALETCPIIMDILHNITNYKYRIFNSIFTVVQLFSYNKKSYGVAMGFQKLDLMALPDMLKDAAENWGLISFREENILYDEENSSLLDKQRITELLIYELSQIYFGNLASPELWSYEYFTKGLAYYLQFLLINDIFPEWEIYSQFTSQVLQPALELDSFKNSPNLRTDATKTWEIISKFDKYTLLKGASLYRMLNEVIAGYANFRQGLEYFLTSFAFKNSQPQGLWNLIGAQINLDNRALLPPNKYLKDILIDWEINPGFPLLTIKRSGNKIIIAQKGRFLYSGLDRNASSSWYVPISYVYSSNITEFSNTTLTEYLTPNNSLELSIDSNDLWILLNTQAAGYYRVNYGDMFFNLSVSFLKENFSGIPENNRAQLLDDLFALSRANLVNYSELFDFLKYLPQEKCLNPWKTTLNGIWYILRRVGFHSSLGLKIKAFILTNLIPFYDELNWGNNFNDENHLVGIKQIEILEAASKLGYLDSVKNAVNQFSNFKKLGVKPHRNLRKIIYCTGLLYGTDSSNWDTLFNAYKFNDCVPERINLLSSLGCTENEDLIKKSLNLILTEERIMKPKDFSILFNSINENSQTGVKLALNFFLDNAKYLVKRYRNMNILPGIILNLAEQLTEKDDLSKLKQYLANTADINILPEEIGLVVDQAVEIMDLNTFWLNQHLDELKTYFQIK